MRAFLSSARKEPEIAGTKEEMGRGNKHWRRMKMGGWEGGSGCGGGELGKIVTYDDE